MSINWLDPKAQITLHFTVHDALWLPSWKAYHIPTEEEKAAIVITAQKAEEVRALLNTPLHVISWLRPKEANIPGHHHNGDDYNTYIGGAELSRHTTGEAIDCVPKGMTIQQALTTLRPKLKELSICIEDQPISWLHFDRADQAFINEYRGGKRSF